MSSRPQHTPLNQFTVVDDCLQVGGIPVTELAQRHGPHPLYLYDRHLISERVEHLRRALPDALRLHYAVKANPMPAVAQHLAPLVDGMDIASAGEMKVALDAGVSPQTVSFAGPGKTESELEAAVTAGVTVYLESEGEMERITAVGDALGLRPRVAVRVNPDFELKASGMKMGGGPKPFGVDAERVSAMLEQIGARALDFRGFHIFSGSQNLSEESLIEAQDRTFELAYRLAGTAPGPVRSLNIGGGFGIPYFPGDRPLDLQPIGANLEERLHEARQRLPEAKVILELGRYLVGEAGLYLCRVIERKVSRGRTFLVTNGGLHHHLAASGNFGQIIRKNYPVLVANRVRGEPREEVTVVGPLCTPLDILADRMEMARAEPGDLIAVLQSGAYGFAASPTAFLSHPPPTEILL